MFMKQADFPALICKSNCLNYLHSSRKGWGDVSEVDFFFSKQRNELDENAGIRTPVASRKWSRLHVAVLRSGLKGKLDRETTSRRPPYRTYIPSDEMLFLTLTIHSLEFMNEANFEAVLSRHICLHRVL